MPNFFLALPCPDARIDEVLDAVPPPEGVMRFAAVDRHLTVAFLGSCSRTRADAAWEVAAQAPAVGPFLVRLGAVEPMGSPRRWSALAAQVADGREALEGWMASVRDAWLVAPGRPEESRPLRAHLTLGRVGRRASEAE
ncbi:MAG: hypothetical protein H6698_09940, partial [Myxococcales bacterium]|nr:hypothetical protein [Myxococcales bacterium]